MKPVTTVTLLLACSIPMTEARGLVPPSGAWLALQVPGISVPIISVNEALVAQLAAAPVALPGNMTRAQRGALDEVGRQVNTGNLETARTEFTKVAQSYVTAKTPGSDLSSMVLYVGQRAYATEVAAASRYLKERPAFRAMSDSLSAHHTYAASRALELAKVSTGSVGTTTAAIQVSGISAILAGAAVSPGDVLRRESRQMDKGALILYIEATRSREDGVKAEIEQREKDAQRLIADLAKAVEMLREAMDSVLAIGGK